ncbi:MAG: SGNH/GDSL hydrolase family protein [bacterium]
MRVCFTIILFLVCVNCRCGDFEIRDGDTVVFLGDSITAAQTYGKIIENYTLLRFPERKVRFINAGWGGDTAAGGLKRLERDVLSRDATLVTVAYGVNDIGWGMKADDEHKRIYLDGIRGIVEQCKKRGARVFICSAAITGADPFKSETGFLQKMCDEGMALSRSLGGGAIDVQRTMREIQKKVWKANDQTTDPKTKTSLHAEDTVHLNEYGQIAMAYAILKGLGAPADVSAVDIDARRPDAALTTGCAASRLRGDTSGIEFTRLDKGLPLNLGLAGILSYRFVPIPDQLNRYMLTVRNLDEGQYEIGVDGRVIGKYSSRDLAAGVNIASATTNAWEPGGTWDAQAAVLRSLTDARSDVTSARKTAFASLTQPARFGRVKTGTDSLNARIETVQRATARPQLCHFVIKKN